MKNFVLLLFLLVLVSLTGCGGDSGGGGHTPPPPVGEEGRDGYTPVAQAIITVSRTEDTYVMKAIKVLSPIQTAYAASSSVNVTYTVSDLATLTIDATALASPTLSGDGNTLTFGDVTVTSARLNKLKVCGAGANEKCTEGIIRIYTQELTGFTGVAGFVNKTDGYGVPINTDVASPDDVVGLSSSNAAIVTSYTIPAADRKLSETDFSDLTYALSADLSNAGAGSYEASIVVELAVR